MLHITVQVRKDDETRYANGDRVIKFYDKLTETDDNLIQIYCEGLFEKYKTISGQSSIEVTVSWHNSIAGTYEALYVYYGKENRFVKLK